MRLLVMYSKKETFNILTILYIRRKEFKYIIY